MFSTDFYKRLQCKILRKSDADMTKVVGALHDRPGVKTVTTSGGVEGRVVSCNWPMTHNLGYISLRVSALRRLMSRDSGTGAVWP